MRFRSARIPDWRTRPSRTGRPSSPGTRSTFRSPAAWLASRAQAPARSATARWVCRRVLTSSPRAVTARMGCLRAVPSATDRKGSRPGCIRSPTRSAWRRLPTPGTRRAAGRIAESTGARRVCHGRARRVLPGCSGSPSTCAPPARWSRSSTRMPSQAPAWAPPAGSLSALELISPSTTPTTGRVTGTTSTPASRAQSRSPGGVRAPRCSRAIRLSGR